MRSLLTSAILIFVSFCSAYAVGAYPYPLTVTQPDGSTLTIRVIGDEFFRYMTTLNGSIIAQGDDGYYYYADYSSGKQSLSKERVSADWTSSFGFGRSSSIPNDVLYMLRERNIEKYLKEQPFRKNSYGEEESVTKSDEVQNTFIVKKYKKTVVLLVEFADLFFTIPNPYSHFNNLINQSGYSDYGANGSVVDYFLDNVGQFYNFRFDVIDVVRLSEKYSYYGGNKRNEQGYTDYDFNIKQFVVDACEAADSKVNFSRYDLDDDGYVDDLIIIFAGYNEAEGGSANTIWPHSWSIASSNLSLDGIRIGSYCCASEYRGNAGKNPSGIGTLCHEFGHSLGLIDLYDVDGKNNGLSKALWKTLSVMDEGNYNNNGNTPPYFCAIDRELADCIEKNTIKAGDVISLEPVNKKGRVLQAFTSTDNEYFLIETRSNQGWDQYIGGHGLVIYHIDKTIYSSGGIRAFMRWKNNLVNSYSEHECADVVEAVPDASDVGQIFFPGTGGVVDFSSKTVPPFLDWNNCNVGIKLSEISESGEGVSFKVLTDLEDNLLGIESLVVTPFQTDALLKWKATNRGAGKWVVNWHEEGNDTQIYSGVSTECSFRIKNLAPEKNYQGMVYYRATKFNGDTTSFSFSTKGSTSDFPYIYGLKKEYKYGEVISLIVLNLNETVSNIRWYIDDIEVFEDKITLNSPGEKEIKALISYTKDSSQEEISRKIIVLEQEHYDTYNK